MVPLRLESLTKGIIVVDRMQNCENKNRPFKKSTGCHENSGTDGTVYTMNRRRSNMDRTSVKYCLATANERMCQLGT